MFTDFSSFKELQKLATSPVDLPQQLSPKRITEYCAHALEIKLLYGCERVDDKIITALFSLAKEGKMMEKMKAMQGGEIVNTIEGIACENREVLHTAMRVFVGEATTEKAKKAGQLAKDEFDKLEQFLQNEGKDFTTLIQVGIGGSDLGPRALYQALGHYHNPKKKVFFLSNVDPDDAAQILAKIDPKKTLVASVSKSGSTLETFTNEKILRNHFITSGLDPKKHFIAVTGKDSPMDNREEYAQAFYIWDYVGGRYSATSMVGAISLCFGCREGVFEKILQGAYEMDRLAMSGYEKKNLPLMGALLGVWNRNFLHLPTLAIIPYSQMLDRFVAHLQQCDMESNGKQIDKHGKKVSYPTGPIIWGEPGTNAQHSFFQWLHQGTDIAPICFIGCKHSQWNQDQNIKNSTSQQKLLANLFAQAIAFAKGKEDNNPNKLFLGNRPSHILLCNQLTPQILGRLLAYFEHKIAFQGFLWNINSFDQEGVQLGKNLAGKILAQMEGKEEFPLGMAFLQQLEHF